MITLPFAFCTTVLGILKVVKAGPPIMVWATFNELTETAGVKIKFAKTWPVEIVFALRLDVYIVAELINPLGLVHKT